MQLEHTLATTTVGSTLVSFFAYTLPVVQWLAAAAAVVTFAIYVYRLIRGTDKKK